MEVSTNGAIPKMMVYFMESSQYQYGNMPKLMFQPNHPPTKQADPLWNDFTYVDSHRDPCMYVCYINGKNW